MAAAAAAEEVLVEKTERGDSFVVEMDGLPLPVHVVDKDLNSSPRNSLQRSLSRKGFQRGERKLLERDTDASSTSKGGPCNVICIPEKSLVVQVGTAAVDPATNGEIGKYRRLVSGTRRAAWFDPRTILFVFASLSSMGTIILIYFTLSITKMQNGGDDAHPALQ